MNDAVVGGYISDGSDCYSDQQYNDSVTEPLLCSVSARKEIHDGCADTQETGQGSDWGGDMIANIVTPGSECFNNVLHVDVKPTPRIITSVNKSSTTSTTPAVNNGQYTNVIENDGLGSFAWIAHDTGQRYNNHNVILNGIKNAISANEEKYDDDDDDIQVDDGYVDDYNHGNNNNRKNNYDNYDQNTHYPSEQEESGDNNDNNINNSGDVLDEPNWVLSHHASLTSQNSSSYYDNVGKHNDGDCNNTHNNVILPKFQRSQTYPVVDVSLSPTPASTMETTNMFENEIHKTQQLQQNRQSSPREQQSNHMQPRRHQNNDDDNDDMSTTSSTSTLFQPTSMIQPISHGHNNEDFEDVKHQNKGDDDRQNIKHHNKEHQYYDSKHRPNFAQYEKDEEKEKM